jgi:hypothetical protein
MKIIRKTRKDISIETIEELVEKIKEFIDFRNVTERNTSLLEEVLSKTFESPNEFYSFTREKFRSKGKERYDLLGFSEKDIQDDIDRKKEIKRRTVETKIKNSGLSASEYWKSNSIFCKEHWMVKGLSEENAIKRVAEIQRKMSAKVTNEQKRKNSPRTLDYWINKGSKNPKLDRSKYQIESSPRRIEYWLKRGLDPDDAILAVKNWQSNIAKIYYSKTPKEDIRKKNWLCKEFYISKGISENEIEKILSDNGRTFSLDIAIQKYGEEEGFSIWKDRQDRWQKTINSKSTEELMLMNSKKCVLNFKSLWEELNIPGIFYIIEIEPNKCKIGITSKTFEERYRKIDIIDKRFITYDFEEIHHAFQLEQVSKRHFKQHIRKINEGIFGWTEVLHEIDFEEVQSFINIIYKNENKRQQLFEAIRK